MFEDKVSQTMVFSIHVQEASHRKNFVLGRVSNTPKNMMVSTKL
jgi:hypothetical protein